MRKETCKIYKPSEKLPETSTPMEYHVVLILHRFLNRPPVWQQGIYLEYMKEWRVLGENYSADVLEWMELPSTERK